MDPFHSHLDDGDDDAVGLHDGDQQQQLLEVYQPGSEETKVHYQQLLSLLRKLLGSDSEAVSLAELADDVIDLCKDADVPATNHRALLAELVGVAVSADTVRQIHRCTEKLADYIQSQRRQDMKARENKARLAAEGGAAVASAGADNLDENDGASVDPLSFQLGDPTQRSAWERRGGAAVGDVMGAADDGAGYTNGSGENNGGGGASLSVLDRRFHPLYMEPTLLADALTSLLPDVAAARRAELEEQLRHALGSAAQTDAVLRAQLPLSVNPDADPAVAAFLRDLIDARWHVHFGLLMAEARFGGADGADDSAAAKREAVIELARQRAATKLQPGDVAGHAMRRKIRAVLALLSPLKRDRYDELEHLATDEQQRGGAGNAGMSSNAANDDDDNGNNNNNSGDGRGKRLVRRGDELRNVKFQQHHPMGRGGTAGSAGEQQQPQSVLGAGSRQQQQRLILPAGSSRQDYDTHTEVVVPMPARPNVTERDELKVSVAFPEWAQPAFAANGVERLNAMQSRVYHSVFGSDRNALVCAPTGGGKTNVAVMSVLRALQLYGEFEASTGYGDDDDEGDGNGAASARAALRYVGPGRGWKVVYIAPMVALAREVSGKLSHCFRELGVVVSELSGDSALSERDMQSVHVLVATPEKWDIVSRKTLDLGASAELKLIIFDEVHMLHSERGPVVEAIAARALGQIERTGEPIRFVGLSATLPNYEDVAEFLRVNVASGDLHVFDGGYRPCPLRQTFACPATKQQLQQSGSAASGGSSSNNSRFLSKKNTVSLNDLVYIKVQEMIDLGPILVFVHSRKDTVATARFIIETATKRGGQALLQKMACDVDADGGAAAAPRQPVLAELMRHGVCVHHAGMPLEDKKLVEDLFGRKRMKVLVSTATLAWGVNLPAHTVIIKGTKVYSASNGGWTDLSILDTLQMFGRAGRPGLDKSGDAVILTGDRENLAKYLRFMAVQDPVESHLLLRVMECVNAEVALGSIATLAHAVRWFRRTYFYTRMRVAPRLYGIDDADVKKDARLTDFVEDVCHTALKKLHKCELVVYDDMEGTVHATDLGRVTSFFNLSFGTTYNIVQRLRSDMSEAELFDVFARCTEFAAIRVREEELEELRAWRKHCPVPVDADEREARGKVNVLLQLAISGGKLEGHLLASDLELVKSESSSRVTKAIHEIALIKNWARTAALALNLHQQLLRRQWAAQSPLRQLRSSGGGDDGGGGGDNGGGGIALPADALRRLEAARVDFALLKLKEQAEIEHMLHLPPEMAEMVWTRVHQVPRLEFVHVVKVVQSRAFLKLEIALVPNFMFDPDMHGGNGGVSFLVTVEDGSGILFQQQIQLTQRSIEAQALVTVPCFVRLSDPKPAAYLARCVALDWLSSTTTQPIDLRALVQPDAPPRSADAVAMPDDGECETIDNADDHEGLFGHLAEVGWNTAQLTAFDALYKARSNTVVSSPLGCGREAMQSLVVAQFLECCDAAHAENLAGNAGKRNAANAAFCGRLLFVTPSPDAAQRRYDFFRAAMQRCADARSATAAMEGAAAELLPPRNVRVEVLTGVPAVDMRIFVSSSSTAATKKRAGGAYTLSPVIVVATPARVAQLAAQYPAQLYDAFDVVIFDHLHTICDVPLPAPRNGNAADLARRALRRNSNNDQGEEGGDGDEDANDDDERALSDVSCVNTSTPASASLWSAAGGGGVRYAELVHGFVDAMHKRQKKMAASVANDDVGSSASPAQLCRVVGFTSTTVHASGVLGKMFKIPEGNNGGAGGGVLQLQSRAFHTRSVGLQVQSLPRFADRVSSAEHHVFRLLTESVYVASSVLVFAASAAQAEQMARRMLAEYRSGGGDDDVAILHEHLRAANSTGSKNRRGKKAAVGSYADEEDGDDDDDAGGVAFDPTQRFDDPLLGRFCPSGVALLVSTTSKHDGDLIFATARHHRKLVCFAPFSVAHRVPSGHFEFVFVASCETLAAAGGSSGAGEAAVSSNGNSNSGGGGGLVDLDVPTMLQMISRSRSTSTVWCSASRRHFWDRVCQQEALPCLPLQPVSLCPAYRPLLNAFKDSDEDLAERLMPHFVAEHLLDMCMAESVAASSSSGDAASASPPSFSPQDVYRMVQRHPVFLAARFAPFAYGLGGAGKEQLNDFFAAVIVHIVARLAGLGAIRDERSGAAAGAGADADDAAAASEEATAYTPTSFARDCVRRGLSATDCQRLIDFCTVSSAAPSEASVLYLACSLSPVTAALDDRIRAGERNALRALCTFFATAAAGGGGAAAASQLPPGFTHHEALSSAAGKALLLALLHVSGKLVDGTRGVLLPGGAATSSDENETGGDYAEQQKQRLTSSSASFAAVAVRSFVRFMRGGAGGDDYDDDEGLSSAFPAEWLPECALVVERLLLVALPAVLDFFIRKRAAGWIAVAVSLSRKLHSGGVPLASSSSSASSHLSPLMQLPGFDDGARLDRARRLHVATPADILAVDDAVRDELFAGLAASTVESVAQWCTDAPDMQAAAEARHDAAAGVCDVRCTINSATVDSEEAETPLLPVVACTPRFSHLKRLVGGDTVTTTAAAAPSSSSSNNQLAVAIPARFLVTVRLLSSPETVRAARVVALERQTETVNLRFPLSAAASGLVVEVHSLACDVTVSCRC